MSTPVYVRDSMLSLSHTVPFSEHCVKNSESLRLSYMDLGSYSIHIDTGRMNVLRYNLTGYLPIEKGACELDYFIDNNYPSVNYEITRRSGVEDQLSISVMEQTIARRVVASDFIGLPLSFFGYLPPLLFSDDVGGDALAVPCKFERLPFDFIITRDGKLITGPQQRISSAFFDLLTDALNLKIEDERTFARRLELLADSLPIIAYYAIHFYVSQILGWGMAPLPTYEEVMLEWMCRGTDVRRKG